jgi:hypothetical protein
MAGRLRVGMSQEEAVALLRAYYFPRESDDLTRIYSSGETRDGREFFGCCGTALNNLPPADQVARGELVIDEDLAGELFITLGPGGVVSGFRLKLVSIREEWRYAFARATGWSR